MKSKEYIESCVKGSIVGLLIGDAVGYPHSDKKITSGQVDMIEGSEGEDPGSYQGPGALALCTIASINEYEEINTENIFEKFNDFMVAGFLGSAEDCSDISENLVQSVKNHLNGMPPDRCGSSEEDMDDGECVARMLPIALWHVNESVETIVETAHSVCRMTHGETKSQVVCALYCLAVRNLLLQDSEKIFDILEQYYKEKNLELHEKSLDIFRYWGDNNVADGGRDPQNTFWSAWKSFAENENDYRNCVSMAVSLGNDANATGSVAGSLSALVNGLVDIPTVWLNTLILSNEVMETVNEFTEKMKGRV